MSSAPTNNPNAFFNARIDEYTAWRRDIHAHPELAYAEHRTSEFVASKLEKWGLQVTRGVAGTGVVGTLKAGTGSKSVGLRADMDALPMDELNQFAHKSTCAGRMHGCGHDGHTVMLLAAAQYLSKHANFDGTVQFVFQPAEEANETGSGARAMIDDGLFERFSMDSIFAMHNWPPMEAGNLAVPNASVMAGADIFEVTVTGKGTHGAMPHTGVDPVVAAAQMIGAWQTIVSRNSSPLEPVVLSITSVQAGCDSWNVIPDNVRIRGTARAFHPDIAQQIKQRFFTLTEHLAAAMGVKAEINWMVTAPATINDAEMARIANDVAHQVVGAKRVVPPQDAPKLTGSEDFAYFLQHKPGAYLWLGNGGAGEQSDLLALTKQYSTGSTCMVHDPRYDFNDAIIPTGATYWVKLVERLLHENT